MVGTSFTVTINPPSTAGRLRVEIECDPQALGDALRLFFPSSPALPLPTAQVPQRPPAQASTNGEKRRLTEKSCAWCGNLFRGRPDQKYHSPQCQAKAKQHRKIEKATEKNGQAEA